MVAAYLFRSAKTGVSSSREYSSIEGFGSLASRYTTKWVSAVKSHLTFRIASIGAMCVGLDEFPNREAIRGFFKRDAKVFTHILMSLGSLPRHDALAIGVGAGGTVIGEERKADCTIIGSNAALPPNRCAVVTSPLRTRPAPLGITKTLARFHPLR
jgi:hypothetical protein